MPRKKRNTPNGRKPKQGGGPKRAKQSQGPLSNLIDLGANAVKGIGRGILPGMFKQSMTTMASAPSQVGVVAPRALYKMSNNAQRIAEFDPDRSVRITGCGLFTDNLNIQANQIGVFAGTTQNPLTAWRGISPLSVDPRSFAVAITYQYYAFRVLRFSYIPQTGTSGALARNSIALGISQDAQEYVELPYPSQTQVLEQNNSILTPVWSPCTISYTHDGTRVWRTDPEGEGTVDEMVQCLLAGVATVPGVIPTPPAESNIGIAGLLYIEYVMDLYEPQPVNGIGSHTVALPVDGNGDPFGFYYGHQYDGVELPPIANQQDPALVPEFIPPLTMELKSDEGFPIRSPLLSRTKRFQPYRKNLRRPESELRQKVDELQQKLSQLTLARSQLVPPVLTRETILTSSPELQAVSPMNLS